jgi:hypothetical protein
LYGESATKIANVIDAAIAVPSPAGKVRRRREVLVAVLHDEEIYVTVRAGGVTAITQSLEAHGRAPWQAVAPVPNF